MLQGNWNHRRHKFSEMRSIWRLQFSFISFEDLKSCKYIFELYFLAEEMVHSLKYTYT